MKFFKHPVVIIIEVLLIGSLWYLIGFDKGKKSQDPMKTTVADIVKESATYWDEIWNEVYDKGFKAGEREGFDKGFLACHDSLGM